LKRILIVTEVLPPKYGGADIAAFRYAEFLFKNQKASVILLGQWNKDIKEILPKSPFVKSIKLREWKPAGWRLKRLSEIINLIFAYFLVGFFFLKNAKKYDVVHSFNTWSNLNFAALFWGKKFGKKVITETCLIGADDPDTILKKPKKAWFSTYYIRKSTYFSVDYYVSKSDFITEFFFKNNLTSRTKKIPYFVDTELFKPLELENRSELRAKYSFNNKQIIYLFVGEINDRKGILYLVQAFTKLIVNYNNAILILAGPFGPSMAYNSEVKSIIQTSPLNFIVFNKKIDFVHELMKIADFYCLPSFKEGFPISIIEAQCCGLPVLGSDIPEINGPQIIDGWNGFLLKPGNEQSIYKTLENTVNLDSKELENLKTNALKSRDIYNLNYISELYLEIY
jgi:glycosyltransferase involved in cell wall biosynthesis